MTPAQLQQYDRFLDENDWDIYYWVTQQPTPSSRETAEGSSLEFATSNTKGEDQAVSGKETDSWRGGKPRSGEWAQTVGAFKPAYRPVPHRWRSSEILAMLRKHVLDRSAGGVHEDPVTAGKVSVLGTAGKPGGGLGWMPEVKSFDG